MDILHWKQRVVGTPVGRVAERLRWVARAPARRRHPELWDMHLEDRWIAAALPGIIEPDHNCVDVGAHIGSMLHEMRSLASRGTHVAFEPVPKKAQWLRSKFTDVTVIEAATSDETGTATFFDDVERPGFSGLRRPSEGETVESYDVRVTRLDDELAILDRVDFLKIDVEGAELPALRGARETLTRDTPTVLFECAADAVLEPFGYRRVDLFDFFAEIGYSVYSITDFVFGQTPMDRAAFAKAGTYPFRGFNYLALPADTPVERIID